MYGRVCWLLIRPFYSSTVERVSFYSPLQSEKLFHCAALVLQLGDCFHSNSIFCVYYTNDVVVAVCTRRHCFSPTRQLTTFCFSLQNRIQPRDLRSDVDLGLLWWFRTIAEETFIPFLPAKSLSFLSSRRRNEDLFVKRQHQLIRFTRNIKNLFVPCCNKNLIDRK